MNLQRFFASYRDALVILGLALALRVTFALLIHGTYDYDEFVILLLSRDTAHGAVPYGDFMFFHPPGILELLRPLEPLLAAWWPLGRALSVLADSGTALLVWVLGRRLFEARLALIAGLLYAVNPLALVSSSRVGQDPLITLLGVAGLALLLTRPSWRAGALAGACLGLALWIKYPAVYFVPIFVLAAPRRAPVIALSAALVFALGLVPVHSELHQLYDQTVTFQRSRWLMPADIRLRTVAIYWLGVNVLAFAGLAVRRPPVWLFAGLLLGVIFLFSSQVYYHYFVPVAPFAALLATPLVARLGRWKPYWVLVPGTIIAGAFAALIDLGGPSPLYVTAAHLSAIQPAVGLLDRQTRPDQPVLADRFEYPFLARRPALSHYFWNVGVLVGARYLERRLDGAGAVVMSYGASSGYPAGFTQYLDARYAHVRSPETIVWLLDSPGQTQADMRNRARTHEPGPVQRSP